MVEDSIRYDEKLWEIADFIETVDTSLKRDIFDYLRENPGSDIEDIYGAVYDRGENSVYGPLDVQGELSDMPYVARKGKSFRPEDARYEAMVNGKIGLRAVEVMLLETGHLTAEEILEELEELSVNVENLADAIKERKVE